MAGFGVTADALDAHASSLEGLQGRLETAVSAAQSVSMPTDAYGIICQPFRMMLDPVEKWGTDALSGVASAMEATALGMRATAAHYREVEENIRASFSNGGS